VAGAGLAATIGEVAATFAQVQRKNERMLYHAAEKKIPYKETNICWCPSTKNEESLCSKG
jgi:hypothetical protein